MSSYTYTLVRDEDGDLNLTLVAGGEFLPPIREDHPNWQQIFNAVVVEGNADLEEIQTLLDLAADAARKFEPLSDRISVKDGRVYVDHDEVDNALTSQILRFMADDLPFGPLVRFFENVLANPEPHSRDQLCDWLGRYSFAITDDGRFVAYKGVKASPKKGVSWESIFSGPAIVDGEEHESGPVPNNVGSVVEMARSAVQHDPSNPCSTGLHVGTFSFARGMYSSGTVLEVHVNPRDVVSVPTDCDSQKMRVCSYEIIRDGVTSKIEDALVLTNPDVVVTPPVRTHEDEFPIDEDIPVDEDGLEPEYDEDEVECVCGNTPEWCVCGEDAAAEPEAPQEDEPVKNPTKGAFTKMQVRAKTRRQNFVKYATKMGPWTLISEDPSKRSSWKVNE
jgi:hypothetical protein